VRTEVGRACQSCIWMCLLRTNIHLDSPSTVRLMSSKPPRHYTTHAAVCVSTCAAACRAWSPSTSLTASPHRFCPRPNRTRRARVTADARISNGSSSSSFALCVSRTPYGTSAYVSTHYVSIRRQHTSAYVSIRQHASAYVSICPFVLVKQVN